MTQQYLFAGNKLFLTYFKDRYIQVNYSYYGVIGQIRSSVYFGKLQPICLFRSSQF